MNTLQLFKLINSLLLIFYCSRLNLLSDLVNYSTAAAVKYSLAVDALA